MVRVAKHSVLKFLAGDMVVEEVGEQQVQQVRPVQMAVVEAEEVRHLRVKLRELEVV